MSGVLLLCRHGETALNRASPGASSERIRGHLDVPLDVNGLHQAVDLAVDLADKANVRAVYASPLRRALATAKIIAARCHAPLEKDPALRPWDVGKWAGQPVKRVLPAMEKLVLTPDVPAPEGVSFGEFAKTYLAALKRILEVSKGLKGDACIVTHTRNLQLTKGWIAAGAKPDMSYDPKVVNDYSDETPTGGWVTLRAA